MNLENVESGMTREKIAGFLIGIGIGTALGFFLRDREENGSTPHPRRGSAAAGNASGGASRLPGGPPGVETDRTAFAV